MAVQPGLQRAVPGIHKLELSMNNNDILRRIRYAFELNDSNMMGLFASGGEQASRSEISDWLKKEDDPAFKECSDQQLASFLNGFINEKRGKKEGPQPDPEKRLNNNIIFRKLKIALNLQAEEVLELVNQGDMDISRHELSAFFRKFGHKHYRACKDQVLRNFLNGVQLKYRGASS